MVFLFCFVVGDSFLIRSTKKFFVIGYLNALARVCLGARMCACMRARVRVGVVFVQHCRGVVFMHPCCKKGTLLRM